MVTMGMWALALAFAAGTFLVFRYALRRERRIIPLMKQQELDLLAKRFGVCLLLEQHPDRVSQVVFKWYKILRKEQPWGRLTNDQAGLFIVKSDMLVRDQDNRYWHLLLTTVENQNTELALTALTELRARRALFNQPKAYLVAFGANPQKSHLFIAGKAAVVSISEN